MVIIIPKRKTNLFYRYRRNKVYNIMTACDRSTTQRTPLKCYGCKKRIRSRFYVDFMGSPWHENCLRCDVCEEILFSFGSGKCYCRDGQKLCLMDYIKLYGKTGTCSRCKLVISPTEKVMKCKGFTYHQQCFHCSICKRYFEKGELVRIPNEGTIVCSLHQHSGTFFNT
uniref:LIM zinc-binding domain-containing protein n=1 Tax=Clytia hemisphaerica TaxID=252671 RepID=A0A7M5WTX6_9CNID